MTLSKSELARVRDRLAPLHESTPCVGLDQIRDVVVVASSSRGGSSMLMELLRYSENLLHLQAELNPFLVLAELGWPHSGSDSDRLEPSQLNPTAYQILASELGREIGRRDHETVDPVRLARDLCWRLNVQWPGLSFPLHQVQQWVEEVLTELNIQGVAPGSGVDLEALHLRLIARVRQVFPEVDPWFYDIDPRRIAAAFPELEEPVGPPAMGLIEEAPFILAGPWSTPSERELATKPLVIKTPSNAYRLPVIQALFPAARIRVLHLVRNPAASINGLIDGWCFRGFHAHRLPEALTIPEYLERRPADAQWWKYDLAPGWQALTAARLPDVCAHQWASAHEAILAHLEENDWDRMRLRFEDLMADSAVRWLHFQRLFEWLGVPLEPRMEQAIREGIPPVMATSSPRRRRWYERAEMLELVVAEPRIAALAKRLGYGEPDTWI